MDSEKAFTLFIESGLHAGVVQRFAPGMYTIGSELESDVVLSDPGVASIHVILEMDHNGLRLEPLKGSVTVDSEVEPLEPGAERHLALPTTFQIGTTRISVKAPHDAVRNQKRMRVAVAATSAVIVTVFGLYTFGPMASSVGPSKRSVESELAPDLATGVDETAAGRSGGPATPSLAEDADTTAAVDVTLDDVASELRGRLQEASLDSIDLVLAGDRLLAQGTAEPDKMTEWQSVQMWFDTEYGRKFLLVSEVTAAEKQEPPKLAIEAVWVGDKPYLMAGGRRFHEGDAIGEGWKIERIVADEIKLRRGDQLFSLTL